MAVLLGLLRVLEFVEFLTTPFGLAVSVWLMLCSSAMKCPFAGLLWSLPLLAVLTVEIYQAFKQPDP
jgi:hypothetical protein